MTLLAIVFIAGYAMIALERTVRVEKAATALLLGVLLWLIIALTEGGHAAAEALVQEIGDTAGIVFFLLSAMTIVEVVDTHNGFSVISSRIRTRNPVAILWIISVIAFFLSAILDNLTTTIVMITLARRLVPTREERLTLAGMIIISANAGGAFSPIGDVTTTMLWIGGQISAGSIIRRIFVPSLVSLVVPLLAATVALARRRTPENRGQSDLAAEAPGGGDRAARREAVMALVLGVSLLMAVPVFKILTGLPPWVGILGALGILWLVTDVVHRGKEASARTVLGPVHAFTRIDLPSLAFFIGILLAIGALGHAGVLGNLAHWLGARFPDERVVVSLLGILSAVIDNVPLVAGAMGMFDISSFPMDHRVWDFLAFCAGTGGSLLVIGSAAGVVAMGIEKISFGWYVRRVTPLAVMGYLAGVLVLYFM